MSRFMPSRQKPISSVLVPPPYSSRYALSWLWHLPGDSSGSSVSASTFLVSLSTAQLSGLEWQRCLIVTCPGDRSTSECCISINCPEIPSWQAVSAPCFLWVFWFMLWVLSPGYQSALACRGWCCLPPCGLLVDDSFIQRDKSRVLGGRKHSA